MAVLGDSHEKTRKYKQQNKKLLLVGDERRKKSIEMAIEPVELCISISPHAKASTKIDLFS